MNRIDCHKNDQHITSNVLATKLHAGLSGGECNNGNGNISRFSYKKTISIRLPNSQEYCRLKFIIYFFEHRNKQQKTDMNRSILSQIIRKRKIQKKETDEFFRKILVREKTKRKTLINSLAEYWWEKKTKRKTLMNSLPRILVREKKKDIDEFSHRILVREKTRRKSLMNSLTECWWEKRKKKDIDEFFHWIF